MATTKKKNIKHQEENDLLNFTDIIGLSISNWYWFILSLLITLLAAAVYLRMTPPVFTRSTSIVIKEDANNQAVDNVFARMRGSQNGVGTSSSLKNEIIALGQPALISKVVERLSLDKEYQIQGRLRHTTLYGSSQPITVELGKGRSNSFCEFKVRFADNKNIYILGDDKYGFKGKIAGQLGKPIKTPVGEITVKPTASFSSNIKDDITVIHRGIYAATSSVLSHLNISNTDVESSVIDLSYSDVNIERADDILNTIIAVYNEEWIQNRNKVIVATNKFIGERLKAIEIELGDVENEMTSYKVSNHTLDFATEGGQYMGRSMEFENQSLELENELTLTRYFRDHVTKISDNTQTLPLSTGVNNGTLATQVAEYNALVMNRSNLVASSTESNPLVADLDKQLSVLRHGIGVTVDNHLNTLNTQVRLLRVNDQMNSARIDRTPTKQRIFVDIERRRKIKEQLYTFLLQTREQNELQQAFEAYNTRVLQPSTGSNQQTFPNERNIWILAVAVGFLFPLLCLIFREWLNTKVRGRKDIEKLTIPFVGELPNVTFADEKKKNFLSIFNRKKKKKEKSVNRVVVKAGSRNIINEAFRVLRTNIEFVIGNNPDTKVIMTTSANPGSGKTFISFNLAKCMSLKGKRVCAIDLDLRRRTLSDYVDQPELGVSDYINGSVTDWRDLLIQVEDSENMYVLPVGTLPPNPAEIISYDRFGEMMQDIRKEFDYIFFDCPPVEIVADTSILAKHADITIFVIRVGLMEQEFLPIIEEYYDEHKFNNLGIILNGTLTANSRYGYSRYGYRYGYGYGYGYGGYGYGHSYSDGYSKV